MRELQCFQNLGFVLPRHFGQVRVVVFTWLVRYPRHITPTTAHFLDIFSRRLAEVPSLEIVIKRPVPVLCKVKHTKRFDDCSEAESINELNIYFELVCIVF